MEPTTKTTRDWRTDARGEVDRETGLRKDTHPDPITGAPGSHPGGAGVGAAAGGVAGGVAGAAIAGAATGAVLTGPAAPVGVAIGAVVGGLAGGLVGKAVAESVNPSVEDAYWREAHRDRAYYKGGDYDNDYQPAYQYGWETSSRNPDTTFDQVEMDLGTRWDEVKGKSALRWEHAREAARDAWDKSRGTRPGDNVTMADGSRDDLASEGRTVARPPVDQPLGADDLGAFRVSGEPADAGTEVRSFDGYLEGFRTHWQNQYGAQPSERYETYEPAYRYGYNLATDANYAGHADWAGVEPNARASWEKHNPGTWEKFKDAARHAYDKVRGGSEGVAETFRLSYSAPTGRLNHTLGPKP